MYAAYAMRASFVCLCVGEEKNKTPNHDKVLSVECIDPIIKISMVSCQ